MEAAFLKEMEGRQYGDEETKDALAWFYVGWKASRANIPPEKEGERVHFGVSDTEEEDRIYARGWNDYRRELLK